VDMKPNGSPMASPAGARTVVHRFAGMVAVQAVAVACLPLLVLSGCGHSDRPPLGMVHGTVTLDGGPLAGASLVFDPVQPGRASTATTDHDGKYELIYIRRDKGAKVGAHLVRISAANPGSGKSGPLPPRYNTQSDLKVEVKPGDNTIDFPLTSK
jgi:hypothetical protein